MSKQEQTLFTTSERETMEWLALVAELKIKELENNPNSDKLTLYKHKENMLNIFTKVLEHSKP